MFSDLFQILFEWPMAIDLIPSLHDCHHCWIPGYAVGLECRSIVFETKRLFKKRFDDSVAKLSSHSLLKDVCEADKFRQSPRF